MLMKKLICFFNLCLLLVSCGHKSQVSLVSLVNPLMGTESTFEFSHGNTYPAVAVPWGMNFWSPQTGENGSRKDDLGRYRIYRRRNESPDKES